MLLKHCKYIKNPPEGNAKTGSFNKFFTNLTGARMNQLSVEDIQKLGLGTFVGFYPFFIWTKLAHVFIYWDKYIGGPLVLDLDGGWIVELIAKYIGGSLDGFFGIVFFSHIIAWIMGATTYVVLYLLAFKYLSYIFSC